MSHSALPEGSYNPMGETNKKISNGCGVHRRFHLHWTWGGGGGWGRWRWVWWRVREDFLEMGLPQLCPVGPKGISQAEWEKGIQGRGSIVWKKEINKRKRESIWHFCGAISRQYDLRGQRKERKSQEEAGQEGSRLVMEGLGCWILSYKSGVNKCFL